MGKTGNLRDYMSDMARSNVQQLNRDTRDTMITATYDENNDTYDLDMTFATVISKVNDDLEGSNMFVQMNIDGVELKLLFNRVDRVDELVYFSCIALDSNNIPTVYELMYSDDEFAVLTTVPLTPNTP